MSAADIEFSAAIFNQAFFLFEGKVLRNDRKKNTDYRSSSEISTQSLNITITRETLHSIE